MDGKLGVRIMHLPFSINRLYTTLGPSGVYINRRVWSVEARRIIIIQDRLLGFSHYDLVVDQLL